MQRVDDLNRQLL
jgi:hypothetical protein